jgi:hypothetical protein
MLLCNFMHAEYKGELNLVYSPFGIVKACNAVMLRCKACCRRQEWVSQRTLS